MSRRLQVKAYAKINLFLEITGKRADGYHTLLTVFQTISLADELTIEPGGDLRLHCSDPSLPTDERNLAMRAAIQLKAALKEPRGAHLTLKKNVPQGAGLGGGSSDAAAVLHGLLKFWDRKIGHARLQQIAVDLGADVPFFLKGGLCAATGIGEKLKSLRPRPKTWLVLVYPGFGVSTKEAYAKVILPFEKRIAYSVQRITPKRYPLSAVPYPLFNRFESFVFPDHPELPRLKQDLLDAGAIEALMSGSGSSVFGLVKSHAQGAKILSAMQKKYNQCWLVHTI